VRKKIVLLGDSAVGKTSLIRRFVFDQFEDAYISTIGTKVMRKEMRIQADKETDLTLVIWDLIGREGYHALHARSFVGVDGAILVADMTRRDTLESLERYWIPSLHKVVERIPLVFVCNKSDLKAQFEFRPEDLETIASRHNAGFEESLPKRLSLAYETSAKTGRKVEAAFESIGHLVVSGREPADPLRELYESLVATGVKKASDKGTPVGALDAIMVDFCEGFKDSRLAMPILRQEVARAGIDIRSPSKEGILKLVEYLAEAETEFQDEKAVRENLRKRLDWIDSLR
jgi:small GTP-binding protein